MQVQFYGVRGSIPISGADITKYGGNSSCIRIQSKEGTPLILDCGTGARPAGVDVLQQGHKNVEVLFTHFHMDHLFGFPFFAPLYIPGNTVRVNVPAYSAVDAQNKLSRYLNGLYHPVRIRDLAAEVQFHGVRVGQNLHRDPYTIKTVSLNHPGGSCGYRVEADGYVVAYLTDTAPLSKPTEGLSGNKEPLRAERRLLSIMKDADLVIMDTMFEYNEYLQKITWGHAYPEYAVKLANMAGVKQLMLFHHSPTANDETMDKLADYWASQDGERFTKVRVAREGQVIDLSE